MKTATQSVIGLCGGIYEKNAPTLRKIGVEGYTMIGFRGYTFHGHAFLMPSGTTIVLIRLFDGRTRLLIINHESAKHFDIWRLQL